MSLTLGRMFKMTRKTRIYLAIYRFFARIGQIGQWFINHCDFEDDEARIAAMSSARTLASLRKAVLSFNEWIIEHDGRGISSELHEEFNERFRKLFELSIEVDKTFVVVSRKQLENKISQMEKEWKIHLKEDGGSCYCLSSPDACLPERIRDLKELRGDTKT